MSRLGILAYGSLIEDPGVELEHLISERIENIKTPFNIEFARKSSSRDDAPTVIPVENIGAPVNAVILVLKNNIEIEKAKDLLWRRETRNEKSNKHYTNPQNPKINQVVVNIENNIGGIETVIYTKIGANIESPTPDKLAELAINSAMKTSGENGKDGISYLISLKRQNIITPMMPEYEKSILKKLQAQNLEEAISVARKNV